MRLDWALLGSGGLRLQEELILLVVPLQEALALRRLRWEVAAGWPAHMDRFCMA